MEARPLPCARASLAPLGLALPSAVRDPVGESRLARAYAEVLPPASGRLLVDLGGGSAAALREPIWSSIASESVEALVLLTHESRPRPEPATRPEGSLRLRCYPWGVVRAGRPPEAPATVWGVELGEGDLDAERLTEVAGRRPGFALLPIHLLNAGTVAAAVSRLVAARVPVVGSDPYAGGRLDGSFLGQSPLEQDPGGRPLDAKDARSRFAPVLALGFLTAGTGRRLPEAALEFAGTMPGVVATLPPCRTPADLRTAFAAWGRHPLTVEERSRLSAD